MHIFFFRGRGHLLFSLKIRLQESTSKVEWSVSNVVDFSSCFLRVFLGNSTPNIAGQRRGAATDPIPKSRASYLLS